MAKLPSTLFDKIWDLHSVGQRQDGRHLLYIDRHIIHELHVPHAFSKFSSSARSLRRRDLTAIVQDHTVPTRPGLELTSEHIKQARGYATQYGIRLIEVDSLEHGIVHIVSAEQGFAMPGYTLACPDSHASTVGALGCLSFGCGTSELEHILATQTIVIDKPKQMLVKLNGALQKGVGAKDVALHLIRTLGVNAGRGYAVEFSGSCVASMTLEERMTLCNMSIEWGCRTSIVAPDQKVFEWYESRNLLPSQSLELQEMKDYWVGLHSDLDANFDLVHVIDCDCILPQISWGTDPSQVVSVTESIPSLKQFDSQVRIQASKALDYMGLAEGQAMVGLSIDRVFIGSCSNSRIGDLRAAAQLIQGRKVASHVKAIVVPGSTSIKRQAELEGLDQLFIAAGFEWHNPGCSMCAGANGEIGLPGERCVSTSNRNYENRQGRAVKTHLSSPLMAAAAALKGHICDVRDLY
jgi:3-isopropylmalate/(R)-2-methylmalate dehydratase large subunit